MANPGSTIMILGRLLMIPFALCLLWQLGIIGLCSLKWICATLTVIFVCLPVIFRFSKPLRDGIIFMNRVQYPGPHVLESPQNLGLRGARHFFLQDESRLTTPPCPLRLGVWHILPADVDAEESDKAQGEPHVSLFTGDRPVIIYAHGNSNNRAASHRLELYQVLSRLNYHVIAFDYRSYGDSSSLPLCWQGLVEDTLLLHSWLQRHTSAPLFFWGHSLGTGVTTRTVWELAHQSPAVQPSGLILEAPFNNFTEELASHILGKLFRWLPWYEWAAVRSVGELFPSDTLVGHFPAPMLILHAEDDSIVPLSLGRKLFNAATDSRSSKGGSVDMVTFNKHHRLGHKYICRSPELPSIIKSFVEENTKVESQNIELTSQPNYRERCF